MSTEPPAQPIEGATVSEAWLQALRFLSRKGHTPDSPLIVSFTQFNDAGLPAEIPLIRARVDQVLGGHSLVPVEVCASTIFPLSNLQLMEMRLQRAVDARELGDYYRNHVYPKLRAHNRKANGKGTYFLRMTSYGADPSRPKDSGVNQLAEMIEIWKENPHIAQSALQLAIRDPHQDISRNPRPFFPCLQQVSFSYDTAGRMAITAYYPTQYILSRAYGNYLGIAHLGWYVARQSGRRLARVTCIAAHPVLGQPEKVGKQAVREAFAELELVGSLLTDAKHIG